MSEPLTHLEHSAFEKQVEAEFSELRAEDRRLSHRIEKVENWQDKFAEMQIILKQQGDSIESMSTQLNELIQKPVKRVDNFVSYLMTGLASALAGALISLVIR